MLQTTDDRQMTLTDRQTTDGRPMTYSEHELEFTFAKNYKDRLYSGTVCVQYLGILIPCTFATAQ